VTKTAQSRPSGLDLASAGARATHSRAELRTRVASLDVRAVVTAFALLIGLVVMLTTDEFLNSDNLKGVLRSAAYTGIVAAAMTPVTLTGNFVSLGIQQTAVGAAMLTVYLLLQGWPLLLVIVFILVAVVLVGLLQGLVVALGLNPIITTLAAGSIIYGLVIKLSQGNRIELSSGLKMSWGNASVLGVPVEVLSFLVFTAVATGIVMYTRIGREMALTGANRKSAAISGISLWKTTLVAYGIFSVGIALVAILYVSGFNQAQPQAMGSLTIDAIAALLLGGIAITGGRGAPWQGAAGAIFISVITNVMVLRGLNPGETQAIQGAIVALAVVLLANARRGRS
jgi:ribose transport system permease protein